MQVRGQGGVKRLTTKVVNIFTCNGGGGWPNQCFSLVTGILCCGHWARLVSASPSTFLALAREPEEKTKPHLKVGSVPTLEVIQASGQPVYSELHLHKESDLIFPQMGMSPGLGGRYSISFFTSCLGFPTSG